MKKTFIALCMMAGTLALSAQSFVETFDANSLG